MKPNNSLLGNTDFIANTWSFIQKNTIGILGLGLIAGIGRFVQEGGSGKISTDTHIILELIVSAARLLTVLIIIGKGNLQAGIRNVINIFRMTKAKWADIWANIKHNFSHGYLAILANFMAYIIIAGIINIVFFAVFEYTTVLEWLKSYQMLNYSASKWPVLLLLKNISIIPFTFVFEIVFVLWVVKKKTN